MKSIRRVLASLRNADEMFNLISANDKIVLGISGGKDSLCLLKAMAIYRLFSHKNFKIYPVMLDLGFPRNEEKIQKLQEYVKTLDLELIINDSREVYQVLLAHQKDNHHIPCSICSRMKKAAINDVAHRLGANKVAFAHHRDDAIETLFMNMIHGGRVQTFEPKMHLERANITFIRPLIFATEDQLIQMAKEEELPIIDSTCPANKLTEREYVKQLMCSIYENRPEAKENFASMLYDYEGFNLYFNNIEHQIINTNISVKPLIFAANVIEYNELASKHKELSTLDKESSTFFIYYKNKLIGQFAYKKAREHEYLITRLSLLDKYIAYKKDILRYFVDYFEKRSIPCSTTYLPRDKKLALECSFEKLLVNNKYVYIKKKFR